MRKDAAQRREGLIDAAARCFSEKGYLVPLEEIAERAGVGRGTLYRNFKDRMALVIAVFDRMADEAQPDADEPLEKALGTLVRKGARGSALFNRLAADMPMDEANMATFHAMGQRSQRRLEPLVAQAKDAGLLRQSVDAEQVLLATRMVSGLILPNMSDVEVEAAIERGLSIIADGLRPR